MASNPYLKRSMSQNSVFEEMAKRAAAPKAPVEEAPIIEAPAPVAPKAVPKPAPKAPGSKKVGRPAREDVVRADADCVSARVTKDEKWKFKLWCNLHQTSVDNALHDFILERIKELPEGLNI